MTNKTNNVKANTTTNTTTIAKVGDMTATLKALGSRLSDGKKWKGLTASMFKDANNSNYDLWVAGVEKLQRVQYEGGTSKQLDSALKSALKLLNLSDETISTLIKGMGNYGDLTSVKMRQYRTDEGKEKYNALDAKLVKAQEKVDTLKQALIVAKAEENYVLASGKTSDTEKKLASEKVQRTVEQIETAEKDVEDVKADNKKAVAKLAETAGLYESEQFHQVTKATFRSNVERKIVCTLCGINAKGEFTVVDIWTTNANKRLLENCHKAKVAQKTIDKYVKQNNPTGLKAELEKARKKAAEKKAAKAAKAKPATK